MLGLIYLCCIVIFYLFVEVACCKFYLDYTYSSLVIFISIFLRSDWVVLKVGFHRVEFCAVAENAHQAIFLSMITKQKLPLYERFSEELCRIAGAQAQSRIQFNFAR